MTCFPLIILTYYLGQMYPPELEIKDTTESNTSASYCQSVGTVNFTLPFTTSVTILISLLQTFRSWAATSHLRPPMAFLSQNTSDTPGLAPLMNVSFRGRCDFPISFWAGICKGTFEIVSKEVLWSVRGSYQTIWGSPLPNVTRHSGWWPSTVTPSIDQALHQFLTLLLILTLFPNLTFYLIARGFHRTFATDAACQQRTLTPPDTWSCPTLGLASVLMLRPISPELVLFLDFWVSNIPRYFWFCFQRWQVTARSLFNCWNVTRVTFQQFGVTFQRWNIKRLLLRCIHHLKSDIMNNMDHMRISGNEPSSVILRQIKFQK